jgi:purine-nucleoside phosphorylase
MAEDLPFHDTVAHVVAVARAVIKRHWDTAPRAAVILGSGLSSLVNDMVREAVIPFSELRGFPRPTAPGHRGRIVCGRLHGVPLLALDGRCHWYEGYTVGDITFPIHVLHACGAPLLILSNASGGLNPAYATGDLVGITDHLTLAGRGLVPAGGESAWGRPPHREPSPYDPQLLQHAWEVARRLGLVMHRGVYVGVPGPNYETRAEYRMLRQLGGDVVGMSTVPEAVVGRQLGMRILGLSVVTNVASTQHPARVTAAAVLDAAAHAAPLVRRIVAEIVTCA